MRWRYIGKITGLLTVSFGLTMLLSLLTGIYYQDGSPPALAKAMGITLLAGLGLYLVCRKTKADHIRPREGMAIVATGWAAASFFGALPFYFDAGGAFGSFTNALFESASGISTTGASIVADIEGLPQGLLLWRSLIQWLGGMGIIVLGIAILPFLGVGGMQLYKAEVPSPVPDKLKPRIQDTAKILWQVYLLLTVGEAVLLMAGKMPFFEALNHAFTTLPTGGFSVKNSSIAHYNSVYIDGIITLFMFLAGINFTLHYLMLRGKPLVFWKDSEFRFYLLMVIVLTAAVTANVYQTVYDEIGSALRYSVFQVAAIITTTGYATADYEKWPAMAQLIIFFGMFIGASAGSTGGGMKCLRIMVAFKYCFRELFTLIHPRSVSRIKVADQAVSDDVVRAVMGFLALYIGLFLINSILLAACGVDFVTALSAVASALGNIGPGFGLVGPAENYAQIPVAGKWLLVWCMLLGRLELFTVMVFLMPEFWRK